MPIINSVIAGGGTTPTGTVTITSNGTHDVTNYATADVNVPTTAPTGPYLEWSVSEGQLVSTTSRIIDLTGVTKIDKGMSYAYFGNNNITGTVDMSTVQTIDAGCCTYMFRKCQNITSVNLGSLLYLSNLGSSIDGMFYESGISSADIHSLVSIPTIVSYLFAGCTNLTDVDLRSLKSITTSGGFSYVFQGCTALKTQKFQSLNQVTRNTFQQAFSSCTSLESVWFYALTPSSFGNRTDQFNNMLLNDNNVTVHFPMAIQSTIGSWSDVTNGFSGTNTTVLFDLVTSLTGADGNTYTRQEKDSTSTATAWVYNDTLYYTSGVSDNTNGVNEPAVSDAIYSDAACTQSVTTITAIA